MWQAAKMIKVYALREQLAGRHRQISDAIQEALVESIGMPREKRAHRFFPLEREELFMPPDRTDAYTLIEVSLMSGRSVESRKKLVRALFDRLARDCGVAEQDVEVVLHEAPPENWG